MAEGKVCAFRVRKISRKGAKIAKFLLIVLVSFKQRVA
jgi:hypothetical protein